jgi:hypothetical protein
MGSVPLVPCRSRWCEIISNDHRPGGALACRLRRDSRSHPGSGHGKAVGVDRGVTVGAALSTGELLSAPGLIGTGRKRMLRLERKLARAIAAGHAVTANREPQLLLLQA